MIDQLWILFGVINQTGHYEMSHWLFHHSILFFLETNQKLFFNQILWKNILWICNRNYEIIMHVNNRGV